MGKSSKVKGAVYERRIVAAHTSAGILARKIPLSGAMQFYKGDLKIAHTWQGEVKARKDANGFRVARDWLEGNDLLFLQEIGRPGAGNGSPEPFVMMTFEVYVKLMKSWITEHQNGEGLLDVLDNLTCVLEGLTTETEEAP